MFTTMSLRLEKSLDRKTLGVCLVAAVVAAAAGPAGAQFNPEALKKMQKEGHKIVEEAAKKQVWRLPGDLCLDARQNLVVQRCTENLASQQWTLDEAGRIVAHNDQCLTGNRLLACADNNRFQTWTHGEGGLLSNGAGRCLHVRGTPAVGSKVGVAPCTAPNVTISVWSTDGESAETTTTGEATTED